MSARRPPPPLLDWLQHALPAARAADAATGAGLLLTRLVRAAVLEGVVAPGARLPSTRALAEGLQLARNTVVPVYEQLVAEGVLSSGHGAGTFASRALPDRLAVPAPQASMPAPAPAGAAAPSPIALSARGRRYRDHPVHGFWTGQPFCPGSFEPALFPMALWRRLQTRLLRRASLAQLESGEPGGHPDLRHAIAEHVRSTRGVRCEPAQVVITDGTAESIDLIARLLTDAGDRVLLEDPGYWVARQVLGDHGLQLEAAPVDAQGLPVPAAGAPAPRLVYLTPSNQFPTGGTMPLARRLAWLHYAAAHDTLLLEDDYDSEYRYAGTPFPSLQGQDEAGRVLYLGSFSKTVHPGIRIAFVVVPPGLARVFGEASADFYRDGDQLQQLVLAAFLREGHYRAHLRVLRREFAARRQRMTEALARLLPAPMADGRLAVSGGARGVHLTLALPAGCDDRALARDAIAAGVTAIPLSVYAMQVPWRGLVLSYAATPVDRIDALMALLAPQIARHLGGAPGMQAPPGGAAVAQAPRPPSSTAPRTARRARSA